MSTVFLSSTDLDIPKERTFALKLLRDLQQCGGPRLLCYEDFIHELAQEGVNTAIDQCLYQASRAAEGIIIVGKRSGSPCAPANHQLCQAEVAAIEEYIDRRRPAIRRLLAAGGHNLPPITWVEAVIIRGNKAQAARSPKVIALVSPQLREMGQRYRNSFAGECEMRDLREFFSQHADFVEANQQGAGGRRSQDGWIWRLVWLTEFACWLEDSRVNIPIQNLTHVRDIELLIQRRYPLAYATYRSGSAWLDNDSIIDDLARESDGEFWVWDNDLAYFTNRAKFERAYLRYMANYECARIVVKKGLWESIQGKRRDAIRQHISELDKGLQENIVVGFIPRRYLRQASSVSVTIFGIKSVKMPYLYMLIRPVTWHGVRQEDFFNLVVPSNATNERLVRMMHDTISAEIEHIEFEPLLRRLDA